MIRVIDVLTYNGLAPSERSAFDAFLAAHDIEVSIETAVKELTINSDALTITVERYLKKHDGSVVTDDQGKLITDTYTVPMIEAPPAFLSQYSGEVRWDPTNFMAHSEPVVRRRYTLADIRVERDAPPVQLKAFFPEPVHDVKWFSTDSTVAELKASADTDTYAAELILGRVGDALIWVSGTTDDDIVYDMEANVIIRWPEAVSTPDVPVHPLPDNVAIDIPDGLELEPLEPAIA